MPYIEERYYLITSNSTCKEMQSLFVSKFVGISNDNDTMFQSTAMKCPISFNIKNGWVFSELNLIDKHSLLSHRYFSPDRYFSPGRYLCDAW